MRIPYFIRFKDFTTIENTDCVFLDDVNSDVIKRVNVLDFAEGLAPIIEPYQTKDRGSFYDTTTQTVTSGGIAAMKFNSVDTDATSGVSVEEDPSNRKNKITVSKTGVYNIMFSAQLERLSGGSSKQVVVWMRKNGVDMPNTATHIAVQANANYLVAAWNFFVQLDAGEYCQLMWTQDDAIEIKYEAANTTVPYPATPSIILTVNEV
jgi:hypothetical protein